MNWIKKVLHIGEKIKKVIKKRATKEEIESSDWTSWCKGQVLKKDLEYNEVAKWFLKGFQKSLPGTWSEGNLNSYEYGLIETFLTSEV